MKSCAFFSNFISITVIAALLTQAIPAAEVQPIPSGVRLLVQKARSLEARDRDDLAAQVWQQVLLASPDQPDALAGLARSAKHRGKNDEANSYLNRLRQVSPDAPGLTYLDATDSVRQGNTRLNEASTLESNGQHEQAMRIYRDVFGSNPPTGGWAVAYYETLANTTGGFEPAVGALKKLASDHPGVPAYSIAAGRLMTYRPATRRAGIAVLSAVAGPTAIGTKAREAWRQALVWEQSNPGYAPELQTYLSRYNDPELQKVSAALQTRTATVQPSGSPEEQLGYRALKAGDIGEAEKQFKDALGKDAGSGRVHAGLGFARMKAGDFDAAVEQFELARKESPKDATIRTSLDSAKFWQAMRRASSSEDEGDWTTAITHYRAAISFRQNDADAIRGLGGSLLAADFPDQAIPFLSKAVRAKPSDSSSWCALIQAKLQIAGGTQALALMHTVPESSLAALNNKVEWKALEASAYLDAGNQDQALRVYRDLTGSEHPNLTANEQIQLASLALQLHLPEEALPYVRGAVENAPEKTAGWELLVSSLVAAKRVREADRVYLRMPAKAQQIAMSHGSFLETLASLKESDGDLEGAGKLLDQSAAVLRESMTKTERKSVQLHLAQLLVKLNRGEEAETMMAAVTESHPEDPEAWRAYFFVLQTLGHDSDILSAATRVPQSAMLRLTAQGDMVALLARAYTNAGDPQAGVKLLETYVTHPAASDPSAALPERFQLAWLLLNSPGGNTLLYSVLNGLDARKNLTVDQQKELAKIWTTWILRSAEAARMAGNPARALDLLERGNHMFPSDQDIGRGLAGGLLAAGYTKRALNAYSNWGLSGAQADDYAGAIGAAQAEQNTQYADAWLNQALAQWPHNPKILTLAGERARSLGDLDKAKAFWKEALAQQKGPYGTQMPPGETGSPSSLKTLLVGADPLQRAPLEAISTHGNQSAALGSSLLETARALPLSSYQRDGAPAEDFVRTTPFAGSPEADSSAIGVGLLPKSFLTADPPAISLEDKIAAIESRNTPYLGSGMSVWDRDGEAGFGRLVVEQASFEASTTLGNSLRTSLLVEPTYLSSGTGSGTGISLFGRQTTAASFGPQNASGVEAEAQLSSNSVGVRIGTSPQGFLTDSLIGGFRLQPAGGPITLLLERDSVKDTILSYSGAHDPVSGETWGGVMANSASLQGRWGSDRSGFYVNGGYQVLDGRNVARNTGINGNLGTWWKLATLPTGSVTVGMNFSGMHYDRNLSYFTYGQGGYFSPQQYFLFSIPVRWSGYYGRRLQYVIAGSLGSQHFVEDSSEYYPNDSMLQSKTNLYYGPSSVTGANFNFDAHLNYQLAPHYLLGVFATASNARNYTATATGIFMKYTFEDRPMSLENAIPSLPDWRGKQPFIIQ